MAKEKRRSSGGDTPIMMPDAKAHGRPIRWGLVFTMVLLIVAIAAGILYLYSDRAIEGLRGLFGGG